MSHAYITDKSVRTVPGGLLTIAEDFEEEAFACDYDPNDGTEFRVSFNLPYFHRTPKGPTLREVGTSEGPIKGFDAVEIAALERLQDEGVRGQVAIYWSDFEV